MPLPGTPNTAKISILYTLGAGVAQCENVFYLRQTTGAMFANPSATASTIQTQVDSNLQPGSYYHQVYVGVGFEDVRTSPFGGVVYTRTPLPGGVGTTSAGIPSSAALAVRKGTATLGRGGRGRWYWPLTDIGELELNGDQVLGARAAGILSSLRTFQESIEAAITGSEMGIVSYYQGNAVRAAGVFSRITSWGLADLNVDSQRRRLAGRGR